MDMLTLLEKRFELAKAYLALTERVAAAITADDESALLAALDERETLAALIGDRGNATDDYENGSGTAETEALLERTRAIFVKSLTLDRKNMAEIRSRMNKATDDSKELQKRREGINKYAQTDYIYAPSVLDKHQ